MCSCLNLSTFSSSRQVKIIITIKPKIRDEREQQEPASKTRRDLRPCSPDQLLFSRTSKRVSCLGDLCLHFCGSDYFPVLLFRFASYACFIVFFCLCVFFIPSYSLFLARRFILCLTFSLAHAWLFNCLDDKSLFKTFKKMGNTTVFGVKTRWITTSGMARQTKMTCINDNQQSVRLNFI